MIFTAQDLADLKKARELLESKDGFAVRAAALFGDSVEKIVCRLPHNYRKRIEDLIIVGLEKSWEFSVTTLSAPDVAPESENQHRLYVLLAGAIGGPGVLTLLAEVPVTTVLMIRAVADAAKKEGEDFRKFDTKIACLQVFALGGEVTNKQTGESGYYASRRLLEKPIDESAKYIAKKGIAGTAAPFAAQIAALFAVQHQTWLSARAAASAVPLAGALMGAFINVIYIDYLHEKAHGHFIMRRLERKYGAENVHQQYAAIGKTTDTEEMCASPAEKIVNKVIENHACAAAGVGLVPVPLLDIIIVTGIQLALLMKLARLYNIPFSKYRAKNLLGVLVGGAVVPSMGTQLSKSVAKIVPGIGHAVGIVTMSAAACASTYAVGKVFNRHFAQGGTFLNFDPSAAKAFYEEMFAAGRKTVSA